MEVKEGEPAAVSLTFEMYPGPDEDAEDDDDDEGGGEVYWLLNTPNVRHIELIK